MTNKILLTILILLVILTGGGGYYAYKLQQQIITIQKNQTAQIGALTDELAAFRNESTSKTENLEKELDDAKNQLNITQSEVGNLNTTTEQLLKSAINIPEIYQSASKSVVRINDGDKDVGSGFVFDNQEHIITANHVIVELLEINVIAPNGRVSPALVTGSCQFSDIAVLSVVNELDVEPLILADSSKVLVGDPVLAIGNPLDLPDTLNSGTVSQLNRFVEIDYNSESRSIPNLIQFDAPVNFGNSGCPLLNSAGEVIGLVIARIEPERGDGINHAVSSNKVNRVATSLIERGSFDYPMLGLEITDLTPNLVQEKGLGTINGVPIVNVATQGPAAASGIEVEDIITSIDGEAIRNIADLMSYLGEYKSPDEQATLSVLRDGTQLQFTVTIGSRIP